MKGTGGRIISINWQLKQISQHPGRQNWLLGNSELALFIQQMCIEGLTTLGVEHGVRISNL